MSSLPKLASMQLWLALLPQLARAAPAAVATKLPEPTSISDIDARSPVAEPQITAAADAALAPLENIVQGLGTDLNEISQAGSAFAAAITAQTATRVAPSEPSEVISIVSNILQPSGISQAVSELLSPLDEALGQNGAIANSNKGQGGLPSVPSGAGQPGGFSLLDVAVEFVVNGIKPSASVNTFVASQLQGGINSFINFNPRIPGSIIYPFKKPDDAPYDIPELTLRNAIHIPSSFTYGQKPPVILVPGTGSDGGDNFGGNMIPLLDNVDYADPVWLNIPGFMLDDIQNNAEYIAYAINYISGISNNKRVSLITWSQGGLASQWAMKYWSSARDSVAQLIATSPDYHGTVLAYALNPGFPYVPSTPSIIQQEADSQFVATLLANGGDKPLVPTTNIYSSFFDEIVEPQTGTQASGYLAGASNNELQALCPGLPAGGFYTHEGVLYNPVTFGLVKDALVHGGQAQAGRINLDELCPQLFTQGLDLEGVLSTEATIPQAGINLLLYEPKMLREPAIKAYAH